MVPVFLPLFFLLFFPALVFPLQTSGATRRRGVFFSVDPRRPQNQRNPHPALARELRSDLEVAGADAPEAGAHRPAAAPHPGPPGRVSKHGWATCCISACCGLVVEIPHLAAKT